MRQPRLNLKSPRNEMPAPGDPRLKDYEQQREMDRAALVLIGAGVPLEEAYRRIYTVEVPGGKFPLVP